MSIFVGRIFGVHEWPDLGVPRGLTASAWYCMCAREREEFLAGLAFPLFCSNDCGFTFASTVRQTGYSRPDKIIVHFWMTARFATCALKPASERASDVAFIHTCFAMPAPPICSMPAQTSARFRCCSGMPTSEPPQSIYTFPSGDCRLFEAPSMRLR